MSGLAGLVRAGMIRCGLWAMAGICLLTASGFALAVAHGAVWRALGPLSASAVLAVALAGVGLVLLMLARHSAPPPPVNATRDGGTAAAFVAGFVLARRLARGRSG